MCAYVCVCVCVCVYVCVYVCVRGWVRACVRECTLTTDDIISKKPQFTTNNTVRLKSCLLQPICYCARIIEVYSVTYMNIFIDAKISDNAGQQIRASARPACAGFYR